MEGAPNDKGERGAVPEAADEEDDYNIQRPTREFHAVAAEGDIDIVAEPRGEGDVPAAPEISNGAGGVGAIEVEREVVAQHARAADGDIGISAKITINLKGEANRGDS